MKVLIIEDEKPAARRLTRLLESRNMTVVTALHSVAEAVTWFSSNPHPELIFLDIQLSDGLSFEIFEHVEVKSNIIFTTAYDEYALKAFKLKSIDYLLKPIDEDDLNTALEKFKAFKSNTSDTVNIDIEQLKNMLTSNSKATYKNRFTTKIGQHLKLINTQDIECFYSMNKGTFLHNKDNRSYLLDYTMSDLESILDPKLFYRVNRGYFVNIHSIKDIISYTNSRLELKLNNYKEEAVIVARDRVRDFKQWLE
jgi:DNA-binding LytR/AlgR family response regulator